MASQKIKVTYYTMKKPQAPILKPSILKGGKGATRKG